MMTIRFPMGSPKSEFIERTKTLLLYITVPGQDIDEFIPGFIPPPSTLSRGLVAYYPVTENDAIKIHDKSGHELDGEVNGAELSTYEDSFRRNVTAFRFDGYDSIQLISTGGIPNKNDPVTIATWFKVISFGEAGNLPPIVGYGNDQSANNFTWFHLSVASSLDSGRKLMIRFNGADVFGRNLIRAGIWYHAAITFDGNSKKIYLNGELDAERVSCKTSTGLTCNKDNSTFVFGRFLSSEPNYFNGEIDEVFIYNRALTGSEISQLYNRK